MSTTGEPITVDPGAMADAAQFFSSMATTLINAVKDVDSNMEHLLGTWRSTAATAYAGGWDEARTGALEVLEALGDMAELLGVNGLDFEGTDTDLSGTVAATAAATAPSSLRL
ncbi:WXG100 family type VII secretion target [Nocardia fusca]|uniref:WXG100 family type VII secretion target n=1 Tax=Nocardia fusca TaxID=941183 RepID=UPI0009FDC67F|nr:WXG100 family type VII secretion target [Nocardia fusca]